MSFFVALLPFFFFFNDTATTEIYTLSLHDALPILGFRKSRHPPRRPRSRLERAPCSARPCAAGGGVEVARAEPERRRASGLPGSVIATKCPASAKRTSSSHCASETRGAAARLNALAIGRAHR